MDVVEARPPNGFRNLYDVTSREELEEVADRFQAVAGFDRDRLKLSGGGAMIRLEHIADLVVEVGTPVEVGAGPAGFRRMIPILGGEARGPKLLGRVLPGGADFQLVRPDGVVEVHARYVLEALDGCRIYIENSGLRHGPAEAMEQLRRGEAVDPSLIYFRSTPRFETGGEAYAWLTRSIFTASGVRRADRVELELCQIL
jgi:hypothetical protein